jgi:hypothetical protein
LRINGFRDLIKTENEKVFNYCKGDSSIKECYNKFFKYFYDWKSQGGEAPENPPNIELNENINYSINWSDCDNLIKQYYPSLNAEYEYRKNQIEELIDKIESIDFSFPVVS